MGSVKKAFMLLVYMSPLAIYINATMDRNYMFIGEVPEQFESFLPVWPYYIIIFAAAIIGLFYVIFLLSNLKRKK